MSRRSAHVKLVNARSVEEWAGIIRERWQDNVKSIFETALMLETAHEELGAAMWLRMVKDELKWSKQTAYKLMSIAADDRLAEVAHVRLPASWGTLAALTKLTDEQFQTGLDSGIIHAGMERKDIKELLPPKEKPAPQAKPKPTSKSTLPPDEIVEEEVYGLVLPVAFDLDQEKRSEFFARLRAMLEQIEKTVEANATSKELAQ